MADAPVAAATAPTPERFPLAFAPTYEKVGRLLGIRPDTAWAQIDGRFIEARLGPWRVRTTVANIADTSESGPYSLPKTLGPAHLSAADRGLTFATNGARGVCLTFHQPVSGIDPLGLIRHPGLTLTVADPAAFLAAIAIAAAAPSTGDDDVDEQAALDQLHTMTASGLRSLADERGIDHRSARKKAELVVLLEADLAAAGLVTAHDGAPS